MSDTIEMWKNRVSCEEIEIENSFPDLSRRQSNALLTSTRLPKVAVLLERRREEMVSELIHQVRMLSGSKYDRIPEKDLRASFQQGTGAIIEYFVTQSDRCLEVIRQRSLVWRHRPGNTG